MRAGHMGQTYYPAFSNHQRSATPGTTADAAGIVSEPLLRRAAQLSCSAVWALINVLHNCSDAHSSRRRVSMTTLSGLTRASLFSGCECGTKPKRRKSSCAVLLPMKQL